jgi:purine-binding chemotaxis protein CheW
MTTQEQHYLSFRVGQQWYGVDADAVIEVLHLVALTELPGAATDVLGLLTLRDQVLPVVDLRMRFELPDAPLTLQTPIIALQTEHGPLAIVVDDADDVVELTQMVDDEGIESPYISGAAPLDDGLLLLIDTAKLGTGDLPETLAM